MVEECTPTVNTGLRGVTVATTKISDVDGAAGKLIYRGYLAKDLAKSASFEEIVFLLFYEKLPTADELISFRNDLASQRAIPQAIVDMMKLMPADAMPMDVLQACVCILAQFDPDTGDTTREGALRMANRLVARLATVLAAWERIRNGKEPVAPDASLSHAANFLYMLTGNMPEDDVAHFFDVCLILHAEHSFNASTFSARQIASTRAHMYAAIAGAIGSLSGELHGGANVRVMEMLLKIGSAANVDDYIATELDAGRVIFGLGHAVYQTDDPRAHILAPMSKIMGQRIGQPQWYEMSTILEKKGKAAFKKRKGIDIYVNVDFYSASLYYAMGIAVDLFTPVFAISRIAGWTAHVIEERYAGAAPKAALYRPASDYVGDYCGPEECAFVPIDERK
ncbi:MAG: citrate/2-methylcitrate synthase [Pseudomonadota bacterium]